MIICSTFVSNGPLAQSVERGTNNGKVLCSRLILTRFHFLFGYFLFLSDLRTFFALKMLCCNKFVSNGPLTQSVERGANEGRVMCSRLIRTRFYFLFGLLSLFKKFAYIQCLTILICCTFVSNAPLAQLVERGTNNNEVVCSRLIRTRFHFLFGLLSLFK